MGAGCIQPTHPGPALALGRGIEAELPKSRREVGAQKRAGQPKPSHPSSLLSLHAGEHQIKTGNTGFSLLFTPARRGTPVEHLVAGGFDPFYPCTQGNTVAEAMGLAADFLPLHAGEHRYH